MSGLAAELERHPGIWRGTELARSACPGIATGFAALDAELPGGGWPRGAFTEILPQNEGIGELRLFGPALAPLAAQGVPIHAADRRNQQDHARYTPRLALAAGLSSGRNPMSQDAREVVVTDVKIPFWSMVSLMVKFAIAAIPAVIILMMVGGLVMAVLGMIFGTGWHHWEWGSSNGRMM